MVKELASGLAIALTLYAFIPYIRSIRYGEVKPHLFSWVIWGTTTFVVFLLTQHLNRSYSVSMCGFAARH